MKKITLLFLLISYAFSFAQERYQYIIIPKKFTFFKEENKYNTNFMTKAFFEKEGFQVFYDSEVLPEELAKNSCLALFVNAIESNTIFLTKINIEVKDCQNKVLFTSSLGSSRDKDYKTAYTSSFRTALSSMSGKLKFKNTFVNTKEEKKEVVEIITEAKTNAIIDANQLYAVSTNTGFNIVNHNKASVLVLYNTSIENIFIAIQGIKKGVLFKKTNGWYFEYDFEGQVFSEKLEIKF